MEALAVTDFPVRHEDDMSNSNPNRKWFGPRQSGFGLPDPICWQGWIVYAIAIVLLIGGSISIAMVKRVWLFAYVPAVLIPFALVCRLKGPSLKYWSSGAKDDD